MKKLYRSDTNKVFTGLLGGIAEFIDADPTIIRLLFLALTIFTGFVPGILFYIIALFVVPPPYHDTHVSEEV